MSGTFVVIWRPGPAGRWEVQPRVYTGHQAARVGGKLVNEYGGEAQALPITIMEDASDSEAGR